MSLLLIPTQEEYEAQAARVTRMGEFLSSPDGMMMPSSKWIEAYARYRQEIARMKQMRDESNGTKAEVRP